MSELSAREIREIAKAIVLENPGGIRYTALVDAVCQRSPETPRNRVIGQVWNLEKTLPQDVAKPSRGLYAPAASSSYGSATPETEVIAQGGVPVREADFYESFAEWLKNDLDEATEAVALGGAGLRQKWGTPDVVGVYKPLAGNLVKFPLEIVSAEIKTEPQAPVVAFGQAIAYRLFSTKTYIAMPSTILEPDKDRLQSLCVLFGIGLVFFNVDKENPRFTIDVRAQRFSPDMYYVNEFAEGLKSIQPEKFETLFR